MIYIYIYQNMLKNIYIHELDWNVSIENSKLTIIDNDYSVQIQYKCFYV